MERSLIGFGEAGMALTPVWRAASSIRPLTIANAKTSGAAASAGADRRRGAVRRDRPIAGHCGPALRQPKRNAPHPIPGTLWLDLNQRHLTPLPGRPLLEDAGGRPSVDVAVMAPYCRRGACRYWSLAERSWMRALRR
jgi:hypothetical protein